ncbi:WD40 repeat domain-containing protein [Pseudenhygromyxa sp. WMMC2535]|uniref:WD40 repeat domain-containing protein n=1 Tax=Pseudenhygromyxa sp. WMMC2535 TaxID=2712867 RepID=UPI001553587A|nr:WD40 repeat domain-containing protein [Pseudenhygromyxa sp. WMMC2535]NVB40578.1 WD40 repeat domain-containing protein [Pseudenhygromyxa sp. WMMC2535]
MQLRKTLQGHSSAILSARFDPDGKRVVTGSRDKTICSWSLRTGKLERRLDAHRRGVSALCFTPAGELISAGVDGEIKRWSWPRGRLLHAFSGHEGAIYTMGCSADGRLLATGGADETVCIWALESGDLLHRLDVGPRGMSHAFSGDGEHLVTGEGGDTLRFWSLEDGSLAWEQVAGPGTVGAFETDPSGEWVVSRGWRGPVTIWSTKTWSYVAVLPIIEKDLGGAALRPGHEQVVCIWEGAIGSFDSQTGKVLDQDEIPTKSVYALDLSRDGRFALAGSKDALARVWEL